MTEPRQILFRAKLKDWKTNPDRNKWVEGFYLKRKETTYCFTEDYERNPVKTLHYIAKECMTDWGLPNEFRLFEIDPETLCEFTGIYDKDGNKIWENDVIVCKQYIGGNYMDYCIEKGYVDMKHGAFGLHREQGYYRPFKDWLEDYNYEVIGNIIDNSELRKEKLNDKTIM